MAEAKNKSSTESKSSKNANGNGAHHGPDKQSKLWQLLALAKEVTKDNDAIQDYEKTVEGRRALEQELETRTSELQRLRELNDTIVKEYHEYKSQANNRSQTLLAEFEQRYKAYESDKAAFAAMEADVSRMRERLESSEATQRAKAGENERLKQKLKAADGDARAQAAEMKEVSADCEMHRARMQASVGELDACKTKLGLAQGDLGEDMLLEYGPEGLKDLGMQLRELSKKCHALVMEYFNDQDCPEEADSEIEELQALFPKMPLSTTASRPAAQMRCAVAEAVIADVLTTQIFVPFYLPAPSRAAASTLLLDLFGDDEHRRTIYRCQVLRAMSDDDGRAQDEVVRQASNRVRQLLQGLVVAFRQAGFFHAVPALLKEAQALWCAVQTARDFVTAVVPEGGEGGGGGGVPARYDDYGVVVVGSPVQRSGKGGGGGGNKAHVAAVLFPQVVTRDETVFNGMALWSNQAAYAAADHEMAANGANGGDSARVAARRRSVVSPSGGPPYRGRV